MKKMKKVFSLLLSVMLVLSMTMTAWAEEEKGSITINSLNSGAIYKIYRLMDLESYNKSSGAFSYKVNSDWATYFNTDEAKAYISIDQDGYVLWIGENSDSAYAEFAKKALKYAKENGINPVKSSDTEGDMNVKEGKGVFENLDLGWYLVDSNAGALCGLTTTDPDASVNAKNFTPTVDKQVQEDLDSTWGDNNTADIGQIVNFMTVIHVAAGAENYVLHDKMDIGLTFVQDIEENRGVTEIKHIDSSGIEKTLTEDTDYTVETTGFTDDCTFEVVFTDGLVKSLKPNERIIVYYNAMLNRNAKVGKETTQNESFNQNESFLEFGEDHYTTHDKTNTYTFSIDIIKTDSTNKLLDGAKFRIYDAAEGGTEIKVVPLMESDETTPKKDSNGNPMYRRARADEDGVEIEVKGGKVTVVGFDNGVYYLQETAAPAGYNQLSARKEFTIAESNLDSAFNNGIYSTGSGVHVVNKTGTMLPETGARGTMMFITFGMITVLGAGVLLVTKKRMGMIQD